MMNPDTRVCSPEPVIALENRHPCGYDGLYRQTRARIRGYGCVSRIFGSCTDKHIFHIHIRNGKMSQAHH